MNTGQQNISVVIPVMNEAGNITVLYQGIMDTGLPITELIFVDDGSRDNTLAVIEGLASADSRIKALSFSRNFGHQAALFAGLHLAKGDLVVVMDGDMQHPPSLLPQLLSKLEEGYDIVSAKRMATADAGLLKKWSSRAFYRFLNFISDTNIEENVADFRIMNRKVVNTILRFEERELFIRGLFSWIGFRQATVPFQAPSRNSGTSKYSMRKMMSLGLKGALSFSFKPLRISLLLGLFVSLAAFCFAVYSVVAYYQGKTVPGWTSIITAIMLMGGFQLIVLGLVGEYITSLFAEVKKRPLFIIDRTINADVE